MNAWHEPAAANAGFREKHKLTFPVLVDESGRAASLYGIGGVPHVVLIDAQGQIRLSGSLDAAANELGKLLRGHPIAPCRRLPARNRQGDSLVHGEHAM